MERRLSAILAADVAGYSRLMEADETGTLAALTACRKEIIEPRIAEHGGRVVKLMGDGLLAEFPSAVEAVLSAVEIQQGLNGRLGAFPPDRRIAYRIGINIGDTIVEDGDIYGDGVNIAARLENLADPGGILISGMVFDYVRNKVDRPFEDLGRKSVKNISRPVRVYRVRSGFEQDVRAASPPRSGQRILVAVAVLAAAAIIFGGGYMWQRYPADSEIAGISPSPQPFSMTGDQRPSIAVLPFANKSGIEDQQYFADGITDDIIAELTKISGLLVLARESTFNFRDEVPDVQNLARDLQARFFLHGSVRRAQDKVRINATLIDATTGQLVWGERYDGELTDVFSLQDRITEEIVAALSLRLSPSEREDLARTDTSDLEAYEYFLRGRDLFFRFSRDDTYRAKEFYQRALARDPAFTRAWAMLAWAHSFEYTNGWSDAPEETLQQALELANKAIALDERLPVAYFVRGLVFREQRDYVGALADAEKAIALDSSYANGYVLLSTILYYAGRPEDGLAMIERAEKINPLHPSNYPFHKGQALFILHRYDEAIEAFRKGLRQNPTSQRLRVWLAATYAEAGRMEEARWQADQILMDDPEIRLSRLFQLFPFKDPADLEHFNQALRKVGFEDRW